MGKSAVNENKKSNTIVIVTAVICAVLVAVLVYIFFLADMIAGKRLMSEVRDGIVECEEILISDPRYDGGVLLDAAEALVTGDEALALVAEFLTMTEKVSYKTVLKANTIFWDVSMSFFVGDGEYTVYLREDGVYVADGKGYMFTVGDKKAGEYFGFYQRVNDIIEESVR